MDALGRSGCAKRLVKLEIGRCHVGTGGVRMLAGHLSLGAFPALKELHLYASPGITEVGIVALAEGLLKAPESSLTSLHLKDVGMGDESIAAVAFLIRQGRFEQLEKLDLSRNGGITDHGILVLAQAIETRGLLQLAALNLEELDTNKVTELGIQPVARAVIERCPELKGIVVSGEFKDMVEDMLGAARRDVVVLSLS